MVFAQARDFGAVMVGQPMRFRARITAPTRRDLSVAVITAIGAPTPGRAGPLNRAAYAVRAAFADAAARVLPADQAAMLPALVLGDMSTVTPVTGQEFRTAGLTHLTAVSGANVTIVCGAVLFSARLIGPRAAVGLAGIALALFVIVVQPSASVLRAAVMGAIALVGVLSSRRRQAIPALAATVLLLMVIAPQLAVDVGLALSVVATAALVIIAPIWSRRLVAAGWPKPLADAVCVACAAQLVTAPLIAGISGRLSLVSAAANLAVAALIAPITVLGSAAAALCLLLAGRRAAADPIHRPGTVVAVADRALGGERARRERAGAVGAFRCGGSSAPGDCWRCCCGGGGGFARAWRWQRARCWPGRCPVCWRGPVDAVGRT